MERSHSFGLLPPRQVRCQNEGLRRQPPPRSPARPHSNALSPGNHNCSIFLKGFIFTFSELLWLEDGNSRPESTLSTNNNGSPLPSPSTILLASLSLTITVTPMSNSVLVDGRQQPSGCPSSTAQPLFRIFHLSFDGSETFFDFELETL